MCPGERVYGTVRVNTDHHRDDSDNFDLMDTARATAAASPVAPPMAAGPSSSTAGQDSATAAAAVAVANGTANGETATASPQEECDGALGGPCVAGQSCQADQSATPLSPPVVNMATTQYVTLDDDDLPGEFGCCFGVRVWL